MARINPGIKPAQNRTVRRTKGDVWQIVNVILEADRESATFTKGLSKRLRQPAEYDSLHAAWSWLRKNVKYTKDAPGTELIKSPGKLWQDGKADCKGFSIFVASLLQNWDIPYVYRVAFYDPKQPQSGHIYPVAYLDGMEVIIDAVHTKFDEQVPFWKAYDVDPGTGIKTKVELAEVAGIDENNEGFKKFMLLAAAAAYLIFKK
jgi:hypothetical protein